MLVVLWPRYCPLGSHNDPPSSAAGHYGCPLANIKAIPVQAIINIKLFNDTFKGWHNKPYNMKCDKSLPLHPVVVLVSIHGACSLSHHLSLHRICKTMTQCSIKKSFDLKIKVI